MELPQSMERPERMEMSKQSRRHLVARNVSRAIRHAFPHIVLITVYLGYIVLGAFAFYYLEFQYDMDNFHKAMNESKIAMIKQVTNLTHTNMSDAQLQKHMADELDKFEKYLINPEVKEGRMQSRMAYMEFTFASSMLFCMTTITTIGYGDIVPTTAAGRGLCVVYAMLGIPLTLLCLADIGDLLARLVLWFCKKVGINKCTRRIKRECTKSTPQGDFEMHENAMTVKDGHSLVQDGMDAHGMKNGHPEDNGAFQDKPSGTQHHHHHGGNKPGVCTKDGTCQDEDVPIFVILIILASYICGGSAIMVHIEGWGYGEAIYFIIITLTTIGFGDIIPIQLYTSNAFIFCIFFILLGLAMMSMTITLLKDKVVRLVGYIYNKIKLEQ